MPSRAEASAEVQRRAAGRSTGMTIDGKIKIRDVAERAGVSVATVSRVLNEAATVGPENRARVLEVIEELRYRPNRVARNLRRRTTAMIGVVVSDIQNPHFTELVRAVEDRAHEIGHRVLLCNTDEDARKQGDYLEVLASERVVGVILAPSDPHGVEITELLDLGIPLVAFDRPVTDPRADQVVAANAEAARQAVEHLVAIGHERIGFIGGPPSVATAAERQRGYEQALAVHKLVPAIADGGFRIEGGRQAADRLLDGRPRVTALVTGNNLMGIGTLAALRERRVAVPDEVAVVSFDDPFWAALMQPALTTLAQPVRAMAVRAVDLLLDQIAGERRATGRKVEFPLELRIRASSGRRAP